MVNLHINRTPTRVEEGTTILEAARAIGYPIPTLCYLKDLNDIGACRVCVVELAGKDRLVSACNTTCQEGMEVFTASPKVIEARRVNLSLILSQHNGYCPTCVRNGNCTLQSVAADMGIYAQPYHTKVPEYRWDETSPLIRDASKCIKCMRCVQVCDKIQSLGVWDVAHTGSRTTVDVSFNRDIGNSDCVYCGQCITHCPVGALKERDDTRKIMEALQDPQKITIVQAAPSVRVGWGDAFGLSREYANDKRLVSALRRLGFQYVFDTDFSADLTIMEEGSEFLHRLAHGELKDFPMFTSCCPAWVRFMKGQFPDRVQALSSAKSPQQMFGAVAKTYYAELLGVAPEDIFLVSVMPCVAKKHECELPTMQSNPGVPDVDASMTTREMVRLLRLLQVDVTTLHEDEFDQPLGEASGAGHIFGATGGVMEAALRSAYFLATGENPPADAFSDVRGLDGWREKTFYIKETPIRIAVASGLANARALMEALERGEVQYDFVEVMACPGGCAGGGGQPFFEGKELAGERGAVLYNKYDKPAATRFSHENSSVQAVYENYLDAPLSEKAHHYLHTDHEGWEMALSPHIACRVRQ